MSQLCIDIVFDVTMASPQDFGVIGVPPTSIPSIEGITVTSYFNTGTFPPGSFPRVSFMWNDTLRWVRGRHTFVFGGSCERARLEELTETTKGGSFAWAGHALGARLGFDLLRIGDFRLVAASLLAWVGIGFVSVVSILGPTRRKAGS